MCSVKLKNSSRHLKWFAGVSISTLIYWLVIIPTVFYYLKKGNKISRTFVPEFWIISFLIWVGAASAIWFAYIKSRLDNKVEDESCSLLTDLESKCAAKELNDSVKKRLGLQDASPLVQDDTTGAENPDENAEKETESVQQDKTETTLCEDNNEGADRPKKRGLMSRFSMRRKTKTDSTESASNIIQLPDFDSENCLSFLKPYGEYEHCFFPESKICPVDISEKAEDSQFEPKITDNGHSGVDTKADSELYLFRDIIKNTVLENEDKMPRTMTQNYRKLEKSESEYLLETKNSNCSTSEIFFTVNECGRLENEPVEFGKYEILREM